MANIINNNFYHFYFNGKKMKKIRQLEEIEKKINNNEKISKKDINIVITITKEKLNYLHDLVNRKFMMLLYFQYILFMISFLVEKTETVTKFVNF